MTDLSDHLSHIQARHYLEEINKYILHGDGEIVEVPGKLSLIWTDPIYDQRRYLAVKASGSEILVNGRRYPATEDGLKQGLVACLKER